MSTGPIQPIQPTGRDSEPTGRDNEPTGRDSEPTSLIRALLALEHGDWRSAMTLLSIDGASSEGLAAVAGLLALSMFCQAIGDVGAAWQHLDDVARILPAGLTRSTAAEPVRRVNLPRRPEPTDPTDQRGALIPAVMVVACRIAWREQTELLSLRDRFRAPGRTPREELVDACIEYLMWVEFDPWTWQHRSADPRSPQTGVVLPRSFGTPHRTDMCARASALRRLAIPQLGDLSESVWKDIGAYRGLRGQALRRLADRPLVPAQRAYTDAAGLDVPVRSGRRAAWNYAQSWVHDV